MSISQEMASKKFKNLVLRHYRTRGRHELPWRKTKDPYRILVSEVMLQQTQVERVIPFYKNFLEKFPTASRLARAPLSDVLKAWQGLGYNSRAKRLQAAAKEIARHGMPKDAAGLVVLPGVGPYTARAVAAFAYGEPNVFVETNIRTAVIHHFFPKKKKVSDAEIEKVLASVLPGRNVREWYWALMDYGAHLKKSGVKLNTKSKHYVKQAKFCGSAREARGAILRELAKGPQLRKRLTGLLGEDRRAQLSKALTALRAEEMISVHEGRYMLCD